MTNGGVGYTSAPSITFTGISTVSAAATAILSPTGSIQAIYITNSGAGYTQTPTISIGSPYMIGIGTYVFNEVVTGSQSATTARVRSWNSTTNKLEVATIDGEFIVGETLVGAGATYIIREINQDVVNDGFAANQEIEAEADLIIDFTERNPFGQV